MALPGYGTYGADEQEIENRRRYAEALRQQGMQPLETQMAGRVAIPISWAQGAANLLKTYSGTKGVEKAGEERRTLASERARRTAELLSGMPSARQESTAGAGMTGGLDEQDFMPGAAPGDTRTVQPTMQDRAAWLGQLAQVGPEAVNMGGMLVGMQDKMGQGQAPIKLREGEIAFDPITRQPIMTNERPKAPPKLEAPPIRKVIQGGIEVQQELQPDGTWKELGRGPRFKTTPDVVSNTTVRVDKSDDEYLKQVRGGQAKAYLELEKSAESAAKQISALDRFIAASEKGTAGGAQPLITGVQNFLSSFGYSPESLKNTVVMQQVIGDILGTKMAELGARGLTDKDMQILREALPRVETDRNARVTVANIMKRNAENTLNEYDTARNEQARIYPEFAAKNPVQGWYRDYRTRNNRRSGDVPAEPPPGAVRRLP